MTSGQSGRQPWVSLLGMTGIFVLLLALTHSVYAPKASALLKDVLGPVLSSPAEEDENSEQVQERSATTGNRGLLSLPEIKLELPTIKVDTPIIKVETPPVKVETGPDLRDTRVDVPSIKVDTPIIRAETPKVEANTKSVVPEVRVTVPEVEVKTPIIQAQTPEIKVDVKPKPVLPDINVTVPRGEVKTPVVEVATPAIEVHVPPVVPGKQPSEPTVTLPTQPQPTENPNQPVIQPVDQETVSEAPVSVTPTVPEAPVVEPEQELILHPVQPGLNSEQPEQAVELDLPVELLPTTEQTGLEAVTGAGVNPAQPDQAVSQPGADAKVEDRASAVDGQRAEPQPQERQQPVRQPVTALPPVWNSSGSSVTPGQQGGGLGGSPSAGGGVPTAPIHLTEAAALGLPPVSGIRLSNLYLLGKDQWCQPPPGQPPMYAFFSNYCDVTTFTT